VVELRIGGGVVTAVAAAAPPRSLPLIDQLLRDRDAMIRRITSGTDLATTMRVMVATIVVAMAVVGATLGNYHGHIQIAYAAIKLPLVLLGTAALSAPALTAIGAAVGRRARLAVDLVLVTSALAFGALLLAAFTPLILLFSAIDVPYHKMILAVVAMFSIAGIASLRLVVRALAAEASTGWRTAVAGLCVVFALVGGQLSWALRPYLVRPRADDVVFVHPVNAREGSLFDAILTAAASARGEYRRDHAPLPGERSW
jgi:hypothetical protein